MIRTLPQRLALLLCLFATGLLPEGFLYGQPVNPWAPLTVPSTRNIVDLSFPTEDIGYIAGDSLILKTTNGGQTWTDVGQNASNLYGQMKAIHFTHPDTGWVATFGSFLGTTDGGQTWNEVQLNYMCFAGDFSFYSGNQGVLVGQQCFAGASIMRWEETNWGNAYIIPPNVYKQLHSVAYDDASHLATVGEDGIVAYRIDSGATWTFSTLPNDTMDTYDVAFSPSGTAYATGHDLYWPLVKSLDGGQTWVNDSSWLQLFLYPQLNTVAVVDDSSMYVGGTQWTGGIIFEKENGGWITWYDFSSAVNEIQVVGTTAYAVGDSGMVWKRDSVPLAIHHADFELDWNCYPNPARDEMSIEAKDLEEVSLIDLQGRVIWREKLGRVASHRLDVQRFPAGMYMLQVQTPSGAGIKKIIIE